MTEIHVSRILNALLSKGFVRQDTHHIILRFQPYGRTTAIFTRISHGQKTADDWLLARIASQLHLSRRELLDLVECTISHERYVQLMRERGHLR